MPLAFHPDYAEALRLSGATPPPTHKAHDVATFRQQMKDMVVTNLGPVPMPDCIRVDTFTVKSYDGTDITVLHIYPEDTPTPSPAYIHAHGGGMIAGTAELFAKTTALTVAATQVPFFSVDYRKAPEHRHPAPVEDVYAALVWVQENAVRLGVDPSRIGITGESAGAGIAAGVAIMARDRGVSPPLAKQVLIYPMIDDRNLSPIPEVDELTMWKATDNITGWTALLGDQVGQEGVSPYAAPARVASVEGLPPLYLDVGDLDIFKAEGMEYALRFTKANISTEFHLYPGLPHGFEATAPFISAAQRAYTNRYKALTSI